MLRSRIVALYIVGVTALAAVGFYSWRTSPSADASLQRMLEDCQATTGPVQRVYCLEPYFTLLARTRSPREAVGVARQFKIDGVIDDCHEAAHAIGGEAWKMYGPDIGRAFASCDTGCIDGCYHGVLEAVLGESPDIEQTLSEMPATCASVSTDPWLQRQCLHGVGHGLMSHGVLSLTEAVGHCRTLPDAHSADTCLGGVFMQNMNNQSDWSDEEFMIRFPHVCDELLGGKDTKLLQMCMAAIGEGLMFRTGHDLERSLVLCRNIPAEYQSNCRSAAEEEQATNLREEAE